MRVTEDSFRLGLGAAGIEKDKDHHIIMINPHDLSAHSGVYVQCSNMQSGTY